MAEREAAERGEYLLQLHARTASAGASPDERDEGGRPEGARPGIEIIIISSCIGGWRGNILNPEVQLRTMHFAKVRRPPYVCQVEVGFVCCTLRSVFAFAKSNYT